MKNERGKVIYIGKARNLRKRLCQYFQTNHQHGKIATLVRQIHEIEVILVNTEIESLILENNLIKLHKPEFNIFLVSDSSGYGYAVQTAELFPRLLPYKKNRVNRALGRVHPKEIERRFGPYLSNQIRDALIKCVSELCGLRTCDPMPHKVCFSFHLKRCLGPCERYVILEEYLEAVEKAARYLSAPHLHLIEHLTGQMNQAAEALEFERASHIRDQIKTLETVFEHQVVERDLKHNQDVIYLQNRQAVILHLVHGALLHLEWLDDLACCESVDALLRNLYAAHAPDEIIVPEGKPLSTLAQEIETSCGHRVNLTIPTDGVTRDLMEIARVNWSYRANAKEFGSRPSPESIHPME